jgi:hypothetical protein
MTAASVSLEARGSFGFHNPRREERVQVVGDEGGVETDCTLTTHEATKPIVCSSFRDVQSTLYHTFPELSFASERMRREVRAFTVVSLV